MCAQREALLTGLTHSLTHSRAIQESRPEPPRHAQGHHQESVPARMLGQNPEETGKDPQLGKLHQDGKSFLWPGRAP